MSETFYVATSTAQWLPSSDSNHYKLLPSTLFRYISMSSLRWCLDKTLMGKGWCSLFSFSIVRRRMDTEGNSGILDWVTALWHSSLSVHFLFTQILKCFYISYSRIKKSMSSFYQKMEMWIKELKLCLPKMACSIQIADQKSRKIAQLNT